MTKNDQWQKWWQMTKSYKWQKWRVTKSDKGQKWQGKKVTSDKVTIDKKWQGTSMWQVTRIDKWWKVTSDKK